MKNSIRIWPDKSGEAYPEPVLDYIKHDLIANITNLNSDDHSPAATLLNDLQEMALGNWHEGKYKIEL
ncbi:MAG: hypothetical protein LW808_003265 [Verrucomicrobiota bacterium]|nr:MAG: hypothetical protein LW808_003265 [Verrucomicrobiota bacterium]